MKQTASILGAEPSAHKKDHKTKVKHAQNNTNQNIF